MRQHNYPRRQRLATQVLDPHGSFGRVRRGEGGDEAALVSKRFL